MLPCISPPKITPMDPHETVFIVMYYMRLCFYVLRAFLPSLPGRCRHTDHGVKLLPGRKNSAGPSRGGDEPWPSKLDV